MHHGDALRASLRATYGLDLRLVVEDHTLTASDLADLVGWLPLGCPLWRSYGGPAALADEVRALQMVDYSVRVLDYHAGRKGRGKKPQPPKTPPYAHDKRAEEEAARKKAEAVVRRQRRRQSSAIAD